MRERGKERGERKEREERKMRASGYRDDRIEGEGERGENDERE